MLEGWAYNSIYAGSAELQLATHRGIVAERDS
jgi:hypothetical protein